MWSCAKCTLKNASAQKRCGACESRRPVEEAVPKENKPPHLSLRGGYREHPRKRKRAVKNEPSLDTTAREILVNLSVGGDSISWRPLKATWPQERECRCQIPDHWNEHVIDEATSSATPVPPIIIEETSDRDLTAGPKSTIQHMDATNSNANGETSNPILVIQASPGIGSKQCEGPSSDIVSPTLSQAALGSCETQDENKETCAVHQYNSGHTFESASMLDGDKSHGLLSVDVSILEFSSPSKVIGPTCDIQSGHNDDTCVVNHYITEDVCESAKAPSAGQRREFLESSSSEPSFEREEIFIIQQTSGQQHDPEESQHTNSQEFACSERMTQQDCGFIYTPASIPSHARRKTQRSSPLLFSKSLLTNVESPQRSDATKVQPKTSNSTSFPSNEVIGVSSSSDAPIPKANEASVKKDSRRGGERFSVHEETKENIQSTSDAEILLTRATDGRIQRTHEDDRIQRTQSSCDEGGEDASSIDNHEFPGACQQFVGFATAGRRDPIQVSEESLAKSDKVLARAFVDSFETVGKQGPVRMSEDGLNSSKTIPPIRKPPIVKPESEPSNTASQSLKYTSGVGQRIAQHVSVTPTVIADDTHDPQMLENDPSNRKTESAMQPFESSNKCKILSAYAGRIVTKTPQGIARKTTLPRSIAPRSFETTQQAKFTPNARVTGRRSATVTFEMSNRKSLQSSLSEGTSSKPATGYTACRSTELSSSCGKFAGFSESPTIKPVSPHEEILTFVPNEVAEKAEFESLSQKRQDYPKEENSMTKNCANFPGSTFLSGFQSAGKNVEIEISEASMAKATSICCDTSVPQCGETSISDGNNSLIDCTGISVKATILPSITKICNGLTISSGFLSVGKKKITAVPVATRRDVAAICVDVMPSSSSQVLGECNKISVSIESETKISAACGGSAFSSVFNNADMRTTASEESRASKNASKAPLPLNGALLLNGFQSAGKKKDIKISEESMAKAKAVLACDDQIDSNGSFSCNGIALLEGSVATASSVCGDGVVSSGVNSVGRGETSKESSAGGAERIGLSFGKRGENTMSHQSTAKANAVCNTLTVSSDLFQSTGKHKTMSLSDATKCATTPSRSELTSSTAYHIVSNEEEIAMPTESMGSTVAEVGDFTLNDYQKADKKHGTIISTKRVNDVGRTIGDKRERLQDMLLSLVSKNESITSAKSELFRDAMMHPVNVASKATVDKIQNDCDLKVEISAALLLAMKAGQMSNSQLMCAADGVPAITIRVDSVNASSVRFHKKDGLPCCFSETRKRDIEICGAASDVRKSLFDLGCRSPLLNSRWIENHTRWIIWKLASVERRFSAFLAGHYLTYNHLLEQLVRRYDREIVKGQRSALRKILNKDAAPSIPVILCVAQIKQSEASIPESSTPLTLELTDGWYSIEAKLDTCLREMVRSGKIQPGTKIMTCDAKLEGLEEGLDPLDTNYCPIGGSNGCSLLLAANGTRLAKWNAKLGFVAPTKKTDAQGGKVLTRRISDIIPGGGNVPLIDLVVSRRYPKLFLEQPANGERKLQPLSKSNNVLTEAENWARCKNFDSEKENMIEKVLEEVRQECEKDIDEIAPAAWRLIAQSESPEKLYRRLDDLGKSSVDGWNRKRAALLQRSIQKAISERIAEDDASTRKITPFLRLLVKSTDCKKSLKCEEAVLTVWQPTDDQLDVLQEGSILRFRELSVRPDRYDGMLQFTASSRTSMEMRTQAVPCNDENGYVPRTPTNLFSVTCASKRLLQTVQASGRPVETDTLGIVFKVFDNKHDADGCVYVTDESGLVLRIQRISLFSDFDTESRFISTATESKREAIVACRDLRVLPYDTSEVCAVAEYTRTSSHSTGSKNARVNQLMSWACTKEGRAKLRYLAACVDAEVPFLQKPAMLDERVAFGYVAGFFVPPSKVLQVTVDCTGDQLHTWNFPLSLLKETSEACQGSVVALNADAEASASQLKCLGDISRARGILLRFHLRRVKSTDTLDGFIYEVFSVKKANIGALASLNITLLESVKPNT